MLEVQKKTRIFCKSRFIKKKCQKPQYQKGYKKFMGVTQQRKNRGSHWDSQYLWRESTENVLGQEHNVYKCISTVPLHYILYHLEWEGQQAYKNAISCKFICKTQIIQTPFPNLTIIRSSPDTSRQSSSKYLDYVLTTLVGVSSWHQS